MQVSILFRTKLEKKSNQIISKTTTFVIKTVMELIKIEQISGGECWWVSCWDFAQVIERGSVKIMCESRFLQLEAVIEMLDSERNNGSHFRMRKNCVFIDNHGKCFRNSQKA